MLKIVQKHYPYFEGIIPNNISFMTIVDITESEEKFAGAIVAIYIRNKYPSLYIYNLLDLPTE